MPLSLAPCDISCRAVPQEFERLPSMASQLTANSPCRGGAAGCGVQRSDDDVIECRHRVPAARATLCLALSGWVCRLHSAESADWTRRQLCPRTRRLHALRVSSIALAPSPPAGQGWIG
eukprot:1628195-Pleurochrysis_carterae.AAC.2